MKEKYVISFFANLGSNLIFLLVSYLIIVNFKVVLLGAWFFMNSVVSLGFLFTDIGFEKIHYQYSSKKNISEYFGTFFSIKIILISMNVVITLILTMILQLWGGPFFSLILFLLFSKVLFSLGNIFLINLRAKIKIFKSEIPIVFNFFGKSLSNFYLILNLSDFSNPLLYLCVSNLIFDIIFLITILFLSKNEFNLFKPQKEIFYNYLKDTTPLIAFSIIYVIATNLGNVILAYSHGHESLSYFYIVNVYLIPYLLLITESLTKIYLTLFSSYFKEKDLNSIKITTFKIEKYSSIIFLSLILIVFLNSELFFDIFLPGYKKNTIPILYIMIFIPYFIGISRPYSYQMISGKKQKSYSYTISFIYILILILIFSILLKNFITFQEFRLDSIEYALVLTLPWIFYAILSRYFSYKYFKIKFQKKIFLQIPLVYLSLLVSIHVKSSIQDLSLEHDIIYLIVTSMIAIAIFLGFLFVIRQLKTEDIKFFLQLIKYKVYSESLKKEFSREENKIIIK